MGPTLHQIKKISLADILNKNAGDFRKQPVKINARDTEKCLPFFRGVKKQSKAARKNAVVRSKLTLQCNHFEKYGMNAD